MRAISIPVTVIIMATLLSIFSCAISDGIGENYIQNSSTSGDSSSSGGSSSDSGSNGPVWKITKQIWYSILDGRVEKKHYEINYDCISYVDDYNYECDHIYAMEEYDMKAHSVRNGETILYTSDMLMQTSNMTLRTVSESEITYDLETGLILRSIISATSTTTFNEGEPIIASSNSDISYFITPLTSKQTYKLSSNDGTGRYSIYTIENGVILEQKDYTADGKLSVTVKYSFPNSEAIRSKLPKLTLTSYDYVSAPESNSYMTCEVLRDSPTLLETRTRTYNDSDVLISQYDTHYEKVGL